ncbi:hypothetical protein [Ureibacillus thermosphaericus]|uniref:hypothetical protein n=1 Tax=Ureibacillus thermosphaericus TaxID=51173 RepID=UPI0030C9E6EB
MIFQIMGIGNAIGFIMFFFIYLLSMILGFFKHSTFFALAIIGFGGAVYYVVRIVSNILKEIKKRNTE